MGLAVAALPLEPPLAVALLASRALGCVEELLTLAALGSVQHVWLPAQGGWGMSACVLAGGRVLAGGCLLSHVY